EVTRRDRNLVDRKAREIPGIAFAALDALLLADRADHDDAGDRQLGRLDPRRELPAMVREYRGGPGQIERGARGDLAVAADVLQRLRCDVPPALLNHGRQRLVI